MRFAKKRKKKFPNFNTGTRLRIRVWERALMDRTRETRRGEGRKRIVELSLPRRFVREWRTSVEFCRGGTKDGYRCFQPRKGTRAASPWSKRVANTYSAVNIHPVYRGYVKMQRSPSFSRISFVIPGVDSPLDKGNNKWEIIVERESELKRIL